MNRRPSSLVEWMTRTLWPARLGVGLMLLLQSASLFLLPVSPRTRAWMWTQEASLVVLIAGVTGVAAWGFRAARVPLWLAGSMGVLLVTLDHLQVSFHGPVPPVGELWAMYAVAAILWMGSILDR